MGRDSARGPRAASLAAVVAIALAAGVVPLLGGAPAGDDAYYHAVRAQQQARCWLHGQPWPRWYPDLNGGIGGPEPRAYPAWPLLAHGALALALGDGIAATSVASAAIPLLAALATLAVARRRGAGAGWAAALAAAWALAPYLVIAVHERCALAEGWALAILPWALDALLPPAPAGRRGLLRGAVAFAALLLAQLPLALMTGMVAAAAQLLAGGRRGAVRCAGASGLGLALAAFSWLPNLASVWRLSGEALVAGGYGWRGHLLPAAPAAEPVLAHGLTLALGGVAAAAAALLLGGGRAARGLAGGSLALALLATPVAGWVHGVVPGLDFLQFPWRWLGPGSALAVLAAVASDRRVARAAALALLVLPAAAAEPSRWRLPAGPALDPAAALPASAEAVRRYGMPPVLLSLPGYVPRGVTLLEAMARANAIPPEAVAGIAAGPAEWRFAVAGAVTRRQALPLLADAGWRVQVDGRPVAWESQGGLVAVAVTGGSHAVTAGRRPLPEDLAGGALSAAALAVLAWLALGARRGGAAAAAA